MKFFTRCLLTFVSVLFMFGCAAKQVSTLPSFEAHQFDTGMYTAKADNFLILFDASSSMGNSFKGTKKFEIAQALVQRMNDTIPEMGQNAGLRSFGHSSKVSDKLTELFYGMEKYSSRNLENKFAKVIEPGGFSPLNEALDAAKADLNGLPGQTALIIITDGLDMPDDVLGAARALKAAYGSSICFYPIQVGDSPEGQALLEKVADIGGCGFYSNADQILTSAGMAGFVEKVFLREKPVVQAAAKAVKQRKDTDKDGVYDEDDQCPGTPAGANVNAVGCWVLNNVLFDFDKDTIKPEAYPLLDNVAEILKKNPVMSIELHGHCDNVGTAAYNMDLSMRRAKAVKAYLVKKGIMPNRMATLGFGFTKPVALNGTELGRALNRRVEIHPY